LVCFDRIPYMKGSVGDFGNYKRLIARAAP
jgi:hypothetical protein